MFNSIQSVTMNSNSVPKAPPPPPIQIHRSVVKINPSNGIHEKRAHALYRGNTMPQSETPEHVPVQKTPSDSLLVAKIDGKALGTGPGILYSAVNGTLKPDMTSGTKFNASDPKVKKLVYNMYRGLLSTKHDKANIIVGAAPQENVLKDEGVNERVVSMMRQQAELREGNKMINLGPPPPPPPPPFATGPPVQPPRPAVEASPKPVPTINAPAPPAALAGAMMKDKKPFTYTPGGINLAEIKSPRMQRRLRRNASMEGVRPSPLAQQPPQPAGGISAPIPPHGMIQVLPVPGLGMGPVVKPQPKEATKPKKNICGPAPPPPPFSVSGESSSETSSSPISFSALDTNSTSNFSTPSGTPNDFGDNSVTSSKPITNGIYNNLETPKAKIIENEIKPAHNHEKSAPFIPPAPPLPPSAVRKQFIPKESLAQSLSKPYLDNGGNETSTVTQDTQLANISNETPLEPINLETSNEDSTGSNEFLHPEKSDLLNSLDEQIKSLNDEFVNLQQDSKEKNNQQDVCPEKIILNNNDDNENIIVNEKQNHVKENTNAEEDECMEEPKNINDIQFDSSCPKISKLSKEINSDRVISPDPFRSDANLSTNKDTVKNYTEPNQEHLQPLQLQLTDGSSIVKPINQQLISENNSPKPPSPLRKLFVSKNNEEECNNFSSNGNVPQSVKIESPINLPTENRGYERSLFVRQSSLPPMSRPIEESSRWNHLNKQTSLDDSDDYNTLSPTSHVSSPSTASNIRATLPWMRGQKKEANSTPEFLIHAQKLQERIQRQRALNQNKHRRDNQYSEAENNNTWNGHSAYNTLPPLSPPPQNSPSLAVTTTAPTLRNLELPSAQPPWRINRQARPQQPEQTRSQNLIQQQNQPIPSKYNQLQTQIIPQCYQPRSPQPYTCNQIFGMQTANNNQRERIIPIVMEGFNNSTTSEINSRSGNCYSAPIKANSWNPQMTNSLKKCPMLSSPMGTGGAFSPYNPNERFYSPSNAIQALQQMQQDLDSLNPDLFYQTPSPSNGAFSTSTCNPGNRAAMPGPSVQMQQPRSFNILSNGQQQQLGNNGRANQPFSPELKKYSGSSIPSRSFRILQAMTDTDEGVHSDEPTATKVQDKKWMDKESSRSGSLRDSSFKDIPASRLSPSSTSSMISSGSSNRTKENEFCTVPNSNSNIIRGYRQVAPSVKSDSPKTDRIINSALSAKRDLSPRAWQKHSRDPSPANGLAAPSNDIEKIEMESPSRLPNIIKQESDVTDNGSENKFLYEGNMIPSRVFKQLQNDFSNSKVNNQSESGPNRITEVYIPRIMQDLNIQNEHPSNGGSSDSTDSNQIHQMASNKQSVLKELTSQFDPQTNLKKPKAAPGRVFRYLQQQYDAPQDYDNISNDSTLYSHSNNTSPNTFYLSDTSSGVESGHYEVESKPYDGCRLPGQTFKILQENIETHPSFLQARK